MEYPRYFGKTILLNSCNFCTIKFIRLSVFSPTGVCADAAIARKCEQRREWPAGARESKLVHSTICHRVYPYVSAPCNDTALWAPAEPTLRHGGQMKAAHSIILSECFNHHAFFIESK